MEQGATLARLLHAQQRTRDLLAAHQQAGSHMWITVTFHHAAGSVLDAVDGGPGGFALDLDLILGPPMLQCFRCQTSYRPELRHQDCPGSDAERSSGGGGS